MLAGRGLACCLNPTLWKAPAVGPRSLVVHTNAQIRAHPTAQHTVALSAHVSRIAATSIPLLFNCCCAVRPLYSDSYLITLCVSATNPSPPALTCTPNWDASRRALTLQPKYSQDKLAKRYIRGSASWHLPSTSQTSCDRHSSQNKHFPSAALHAHLFLRLVMGSW
jgi:hypothetical protein